MTKKSIFTIIGILIAFLSEAQIVTVRAYPGGTYSVPKKAKNLKIVVVGSGSVEQPFIIKSRSKTKKSTLTGNSYIKVQNEGSNIVIRDLIFKDNMIDYRASTSLIEIGNSKKSSINNVVIEDVIFQFNNNHFIDRERDTQFHWINIFGHNVVVKNCQFSGKRNRLPVMHINTGFDGVIIEQNTFRDTPSRKGEALEAVRIGLADGNSNAEILRNRFINYHGDSETISVKANNVVISENSFIDSRSGVSVRYADNCEISNNTFVNTNIPVRIAGKNHKITGNIFNKNRENRSIVFMAGGEHYPAVENVDIESNRFNLANVTLDCIQFPNHNSFPLNIRFNENRHNDIPLKNQKINLENQPVKAKNTRKDNTILYNYNL